ncbi:MAG TPA: hypothetical protein DCG49_07515 [Ruminococcus sp.]|nr:hypothetical protein [Ruminococcus sp.]
MTNFKQLIARTLSITVIAMTLSATAFPANAGEKLIQAGFESGMDGFAARATESVERTSAKAYQGSYSVLVSNRTEAWNGAVASLGAGFNAGDTYSFSCAVYQSSGAAVDMQLSLEYEDATGTKNYVHVAPGSVDSDTWTVLSNPSYTIPADASACKLYVETAESLCDFYVDEIIAEAPTHYLLGDVNQSEKIDKEDVTELMKYLLGQEATVYLETADMNGDGKLNAVDLSMLRQRFAYPDRFTTTTTTTTTAATTTRDPGAAWPTLKNGDKWYNTADISWIPAGKKTVALSFDDGPAQGGMSVQNTLNAQGFHATFFYQGNKINGSNESEIKAAEAGGHEVANHTWSHTDMRGMGSGQILNEYNQCKDKLNQVLGVKRDYLVRLPFLGYDSTIASTMPVPMPNCGLDTEDWNHHTTQQIIQTVQGEAMSGALNGKVVLMHETENASVEALKTLVPWLDQNGYVVCTVSEMFKYNNKEMICGRKYDSCMY